MLLLLALACAPSDAVDTSDLGGSVAVDTAVRAELQLRFPVGEPERIETDYYVGVDHDPEVHGDRSALCENYVGKGFPWCYDEHDGSDFILLGGFDAMDAGSATVVASADGVVEETEDGNYDRCHAEISGVDCDGYPMRANYVILRHPTGEATWYWHLMKGSVAVQVGQEVKQGDKLGMIGSSGNSSFPHVHLQLVNADDEVVDPFAGPYSQEETWWCHQNEEGELPGLCD